MKPVWLTLPLAAVLSAWFGLAKADESKIDLLYADPPGSYMAVEGPVSVSGVDPLPFSHLPLGEYRLTADVQGLPAARGRLLRTDEGLSRRPWAGPATLLAPPGIAHLRRGETRGWIHLAAGAFSATMAALQQRDLEDAADERDAAMAAYGRALSEEGIRGARGALLGATGKENDHREVRNLWLGYSALMWVAAGAEALLLTPQPELASTVPGLYTATFPRATPAGLALRSALIPGAGQRYMGRSGWGSFFFSATAALAAGTIAAHGDYLDARRHQAAAQLRFDEAEAEDELLAARQELLTAADDADEKNTIRWVLAGAAAGVYLWNVLDAIDQNCQPMVPGVAFSMSPAPDGAYLCLAWRIL